MTWLPDVMVPAASTSGAVFPLPHEGADGLLMPITPKYPLIVLNPGCVTTMLMPITSMVGAVQAPVVAGLVGQFDPGSTPVIGMAVLVRRLMLNGISTPVP